MQKEKISKSNKSEFWKCLSYRGLPNFFEVGSQTFLNDYKICPRQWGVHGHLARFQPKKEHSFDTKCWQGLYKQEHSTADLNKQCHI